MKTVKILSVVFAMFLAGSLMAQAQKATIKTSAQCEMCKESIEASLSKLNGVKKATLNPKTKELSVKYDESVVSLEDIKKAVSKTGYWADNVMPDKDAYAALPACCKPQKSCCAGGAEKKSCSSTPSAEGAQKKSCCTSGAAAGSGEQKKTCASGHQH